MAERRRPRTTEFLTLRTNPGAHDRLRELRNRIVEAEGRPCTLATAFDIAVGSYSAALQGQEAAAPHHEGRRPPLRP